MGITESPAAVVLGTHRHLVPIVSFDRHPSFECTLFRVSGTECLYTLHNAVSRWLCGTSGFCSAECELRDITSLSACAASLRTGGPEPDIAWQSGRILVHVLSCTTEESPIGVRTTCQSGNSVQYPLCTQEFTLFAIPDVVVSLCSAIACLCSLHCTSTFVFTQAHLSLPRLITLCSKFQHKLSLMHCTVVQPNGRTVVQPNGRTAVQPNSEGTWGA